MRRFLFSCAQSLIEKSKALVLVTFNSYGGAPPSKFCTIGLVSFFVSGAISGLVEFRIQTKKLIIFKF
jgi:hypothetical protein